MHNSKYVMAMVALLLFTALSVISVQATIDIEAKPDRMAVAPGQIFDVVLYVTPTSEIDTVAVNLSMWDLALAEVMEITRGANGQDPLFSDSTVWIGGKEIKNDLGYIKHIVWGSITPTSAPGYLATITFKAKGTGEFIFNIPPGQFDAARAGERVQTNVLSASFAQEIPVITAPAEKSGIDMSFMSLVIGIVVCICIFVFVLFTKINKKETKEINDVEQPRPQMAAVKPNTIKVKRL